MRALLPVSFVILAGCGQSGDLYLPPKAPPADAPPIEAPPPVEGTKERKDEQKDAQ